MREAAERNQAYLAYLTNQAPQSSSSAPPASPYTYISTRFDGGRDDARAAASTLRWGAPHKTTALTPVQFPMGLSDLGDGWLLLTWGRGTLGVLGHGDNVNLHTPRRVEELSNVRVTAVAAGVVNDMV